MPVGGSLGLSRFACAIRQGHFCDNGLVSVVSLVGREGLLAGLRRAVRAAAAGRGGLVLLTGDAGIGKTSVAAAAADGARLEGAVVAWGTCREGTAAPGLWAWREVLRDLAGLVGWQRLATLAGGGGDGLALLAPGLLGSASVDGGRRPIGWWSSMRWRRCCGGWRANSRSW